MGSDAAIEACRTGRPAAVLIERAARNDQSAEDMAAGNEVMAAGTAVAIAARRTGVPILVGTFDIDDVAAAVLSS